jgi:hypothetical protein
MLSSKVVWQLSGEKMEGRPEREAGSTRQLVQYLLRRLSAHNVQLFLTDNDRT